MTGYIKLHRKFTQWEWYNDLNTRAVFLHLLLKANYKPSRFMGNQIPIGGLVIGITALSDAVGLSVQQTRTALKKLKSTNEINIKSTNKFSICTIVKWADYQGGQHSDNKRATNEQQTSNKRATTSKEGKKERREEDIKNKQKNKAIPSNAKEVEEYAKSIDYFVDGQQFIDHYEANGWMRGKNKVKCWKACLRTWKRNDKANPQEDTSQRLNYL